MKLPRVTGDKVQKALQRADFILVHTKGSHHFLYHAEKTALSRYPCMQESLWHPKP